MRAHIDYEERRTELARIAAGLIAAGGADAATVRAVAKEAGFSTKVVSHYFADKDALMLMTYRYSAQRLGASTARATQQAEGSKTRAFTRALLPTTPECQDNWRVWFAFWGRAVNDPQLLLEQRQRVDNARATISRLMKNDPDFRGLATEAREKGAESLLTLIFGVAMQSIFDLPAWPPARQNAVLEDRLAALRADPAETRPATEPADA